MSFIYQNIIVNLSSFDLCDYHVSLVNKGMTFCLKPGESDMEELPKDLDRFHRLVRLIAFFDQNQKIG